MNGGAAKDVLDFFVLNENGTVTPDPDRTDGDLSFKFNLSRCDPSLPEASAKCEWSTTRFCNDTLIDAKELSAALPSNIKNSTLSRRASKLSIRNTIKSFAPDMLMTYMLKRMALKDDSAMTPFSTVFDGVCLLADISGFTRLSGRFCEDGKDGIDQLQQATNGYLSILIEIVYAYGGDVMKFAGDALVCVFQASGVDNGGVRKVTLSDVCTSAVQCATELTQVCTNQLTVHVALSCGPICLSMLGGYNDLWECLISGECLGHLSKCLDDAGSKQAVVSPEFTEALGPIYRKELNIEKLPSGNFLVISAAQMTSKVIKKMIMKRTAMLMKHSESRFSMFPNDNAFIRDVSKFIPLPVSIGLMSGSFDYLAELREVTTMFMSWDSYNEVIHRDLLSLQGYFTTAQEVLGNSGGFIRQFLIDDKGCVLIACWGVPTASHPDNTRRALCAGAIIGQKLSALGMETSVGITTGNVFCGSVGSYVRREYAVIGDVVNLAARLMGKADSGLLLDEATFLSLPRYLKLLMGEMKPITVKGRDKPIASYRLKKSEKILDFNDRDDTDVLLDTLTKPAVFEDTILREIESATRKPTVLKTIIVEGKAGLSTMEISKWLIGIGIKMNIRVISMQMMSKNSCNEYSMAAQLFRLLVGKDEFDDPKGQQIIVDKILQEVYKSEQETAKKVYT